MKKIKYCWLILFFLQITACSDEKYIFSESALDRIQEQYNKCQEELRGATDGWKLEYYPKPGTYGGFTFMFDFKVKNRVVMIADFMTEREEYSYNLNLSESLVLTFDSYSPLHVLADPEYQPLGQRKGIGIEGDFEFVVEKLGKDTITLKGKKRQNRYQLIRAAAADWLDVEGMDEVVNDFSLNASQSLLMKVNGSLYAGASGGFNDEVRMFTLNYANEEGDVKITEPYTITSRGIVFGRSLTISGVTFDGLIADKTNGFNNRVFKSNDPANAIQFTIKGPLGLKPGDIPTFTPDPEVTSGKDLYDGTKVTYKVTLMSDDLQALVDVMKADLPNFVEYRLEMPRSSYLGSLEIAAVDLDGATKCCYYNFNGYDLINNSVNQVVFSRNGGGTSYTSGFNSTERAKYTNHSSAKKIVDIFFAGTGFTVIEDEATVFWIRSNANPNTWMKLVK